MQRKWMMFVDGENFTIRAQEYAKKQKKELPQPHLRDVFWWSGEVDGEIVRLGPNCQLEYTAVRRYYYTCLTGDEGAIESLLDVICERDFTPYIAKKKKGMRAKGVDISLTKDMLVHAFFNHYDTAVLVAGDGDYVPLVEEVKRLGKRVILLFFDESNGLSKELRRTADGYCHFRPKLP